MKDECRCPALQAASEVEDLIHMTGLARGVYGQGRALLVGVLRDKHGCSGPAKSGQCPWLMALMGIGADVELDYRQPELRPKPSGKPPGEYL